MQKSKVKSPKPETRNLNPVLLRPGLYTAQHKAIFRAANELGLDIEALRDRAGAINLGIRSLSRLTLRQRQVLIDDLRALGATARNPEITRYDLEDEQRAAGKLHRFPAVTDKQLVMLNALAAQVRWREQDGYLRFCHATIQAPAPRNGRDVTTLKLALHSLVKQQLTPEPRPLNPDPCPLNPAPF